MPTDYLAIYLNDHFAGAKGGIELARRTSASNRDEPAFGAPLEQICAEIEADRETLAAVMQAAGVSRDRVKPAGAWIGEKLGRLKLNGQLRGYSPLGRVLELEGLTLGITGKLRLWTLLGERRDPRLAGFDFETLAAQAEAQRTTVEALQSAAAHQL